MKICFETPTLTQASAIALGTFDGLHLGHRQVIAGMQAHAQAQGLARWVYTFKNHPAEVLRPEKTPLLLTTWQEKITLLQQLGPLEGIVLQSFDQDFSEISPEAFVEEILVKQMQTRQITVGYNFRFGHRARGDVELLSAMGQQLGFAVEVIPAQQHAGEVVSSTRIRALLAQGELAAALELLGQQYLIQGEVVRGQGIAAKVLGVPTANLAFEQTHKQLPRKGVYACQVRLATEKQLRQGVLNLGLRPTFAGQDLSLEVFILDYSGDLYGQQLEVYPQQFLRPEQRFEGPDALKAQIHRDIAQAQQFFASSPK